MRYTRLPPPASLVPYVQYVWRFNGDSTTAALQTFGPVAAGCPGIVYQPNNGSAFYDQAGKHLPSLFLYGQTIRPMLLQTTRLTNMVGFCLQPHALKTVFGLDAFELTDTCLDLGTWADQHGYPLTNRLADVPDASFAIAEISRFLMTQLARANKPVEGGLQLALDQLWTSGGNVPLRDLQRLTGRSERSLERLFQQVVGVPPKQFGRISRFQRALTQLRERRYTALSDVAFDNGYADQSHFIRTFREFTGLTPRDYQLYTLEVIDNLPQRLT